MKAPSKTLAAVLLFVGLAITATQWPGRPSRPGPLPLFDLLDTDRDGQISEAELAAAPAVLRALDRDGDGVLARREVRAAAMPPPPSAGSS